MPIAKNVVITVVFIFFSMLFTGCFLFGGGGKAVSSEDEVQDAASKFQAKGDKKELDRLIEGFQDEANSIEVRMAAAEALARAGDPDANLELIKGLSTLSGLNLELYRTVARAIGETGDPNAAVAISEALANTRNSYAQLRGVLLDAMQRTSDEQSVTALMEALQASKEDYFTLQQTVSEALGGIGDDKVVPALMSIAKDTDVDIAVRSHAVEILGRKKDPNLVPFLLEMFNDPKSQAQVRDFALKAVEDVKDDKIILLLLEAFQQGRQEYLSLMNALAQALGEVGDVRAAPTLVRIARDDQLNVLVRRTAIRNLARLNNPNVVIDLVELMHEPKNYVLFEDVYNTVRQLGGDEGIKTLRAAAAAAQIEAARNAQRTAIAGN